MPMYAFYCRACKQDFEELCTFMEFDEGFNKVTCPDCDTNNIDKNIMVNNCPTALFTDPTTSSKWDNFEYRAEWNMEKARKERQSAEVEAKKKNITSGYRENLSDHTENGRRMNFID